MEGSLKRLLIVLHRRTPMGARAFSNGTKMRLSRVTLQSTIKLAKGNHPVIRTASGPVVGFEYVSPQTNKTNNVFLGIPYARPPVGELRFEKPQPYNRWKIPLKAFKYSAGCVPHNEVESIYPTCEDCLTINVVAPQEPSTEPDGYPILFVVHPSCYNFASSQWISYQSCVQNFVDRGVIVVTFNHRLGILSFASTGDNVMPGNLGLFDMAMALRWTYDNIGAFGGDKTKIAGIGISAGAASVGQLAMSPYSRDYMSKTIQMSGSYYSLWTTNDDVVKETTRLADALGIPVNDSQSLKEAFKVKSAKEITDALAIIGSANSTTNVAKFSPRLDGVFLPKDYHDLVKERTPLPSMMCSTSDESVFFAILGFMRSCNGITIEPDEIARFSEDDIVRRVRDHLFSEAEFGQYAKPIQDRVLKFYMKKKLRDFSNPLSNLERFVRIQSDLQFFMPMQFDIMERIQIGWPTFIGRNEHFADHHFHNGVPLKGCVHASEMRPLFDFPVPRMYKMDENDVKHRNVYAEAICQFVKTGNPSNDLLQWPEANRSMPFRHVGIKPEPVVRDAYNNRDASAINFWKELVRDFGEVAMRGISYKRHLSDYRSEHQREEITARA